MTPNFFMRKFGNKGAQGPAGRFGLCCKLFVAPSLSPGIWSNYIAVPIIALTLNISMIADICALNQSIAVNPLAWLKLCHFFIALCQNKKLVTRSFWSTSVVTSRALFWSDQLWMSLYNKILKASQSRLLKNTFFFLLECNHLTGIPIKFQEKEKLKTKHQRCCDILQEISIITR